MARESLPVLPSSCLPSRKVKPGRVSSLRPGKEHTGWSSLINEVKQIRRVYFDVLYPGGFDKNEKEDK